MTATAKEQAAMHIVSCLRLMTSSAGKNLIDQASRSAEREEKYAENTL